MCVNDNERRNKPRNDVTNEFSVCSEVPNYIRVTDFEKEKSASVHLAHLFRHTHSQNKVPEELGQNDSIHDFIYYSTPACLFTNGSH